MEVLTNFLESNTIPALSAFVLGLMTAISPCPLATNVTALGFISKDIKNNKKVFYNGLIYTLLHPWTGFFLHIACRDIILWRRPV